MEPSLEPEGTVPDPPKAATDDVIDIGAAVAVLLEQARAATAGRAARTLAGGAGASLKQTMMALVRGTTLSEHDSPGSASLQVLRGQVRLVAGDTRWDLGENEYALIPSRRHSLESLEDSVVLLTVASGGAPAA
jgi:quercetin dioxygenase-like cupin family protein